MFGNRLRDELPEPRGVVELGQMTEFVHHDIVRDPFRQQQELPVEIQVAGLGAAPPARLLVTDRYPAVGKPVQTVPMRDLFPDENGSLGPSFPVFAFPAATEYRLPTGHACGLAKHPLGMLEQEPLPAGYRTARWHRQHDPPAFFRPGIDTDADPLRPSIPTKFIGQHSTGYFDGLFLVWHAGQVTVSR